LVVNVSVTDESVFLKFHNLREVKLNPDFFNNQKRVAVRRPY